MQRYFFSFLVLLLIVNVSSCQGRSFHSQGGATHGQSKGDFSPPELSSDLIQGSGEVVTGAERSEEYLPLLAGKTTGLVVNHTSLNGKEHLLDFLLGNDVKVARVFAPEHGFRGEASAGEKVSDGRDEKTGVEIVSLYGENRKPTPTHLEGIDLMVFDIQDVGCRFYTYLSTLCLVIEACAEHGIPLVVLDRPNPNGDYVAGPLLKPEFTSFVGMIPVPVVHGCTMGEIALVVNGEKWHKAPRACDITVIKTENYTHLTQYEPPVAPSPNLPNYQSIRLYPSLCFFEATSVSIGRGTPFPFQVIGGTLPHLGSFTFVPVDIPGVAAKPVNQGKTCYGTDLRELNPVPQLTFSFFMEFFRKFPVEKEFLTSERWFNLLAGDPQVLKAIREGKSEQEITALWQKELESFKTLRKKYLLYPEN